MPSSDQKEHKTCRGCHVVVVVVAVVVVVVVVVVIVVVVFVVVVVVVVNVFVMLAFGARVAKKKDTNRFFSCLVET